MDKTTVEGWKQIGTSFSIEPRGRNWAVLNGTDLVCIVRGRDTAYDMATRCQRQQDERKNACQGTAPTQSASNEKQDPNKNVRTRSRADLPNP